MSQLHQYFGEINGALDELIRCQRDEQEIILTRDMERLPTVCGRMNQLVSTLHQKQMGLQKVCREVPADCQAILRECKTKFSLLQALATQNHVLLEGNLGFLQGVFREVFGKGRPTDLYNEMGMITNSVGGSGGFLQVKV